MSFACPLLQKVNLMARVRRSDNPGCGWTDFPGLTLIEAGKEYLRNMDPGPGAQQPLDLQLHEGGEVFKRTFVVREVIECINARGTEGRNESS